MAHRQLERAARDDVIAGAGRREKSESFEATLSDLENLFGARFKV
jgi:hypothetical protein